MWLYCMDWGWGWGEQQDPKTGLEAGVRWRAVLLSGEGPKTTFRVFRQILKGPSVNNQSFSN